MGQWIELHVDTGEFHSREELAQRLLEAGVKKHPDYEGVFMINGGILEPNDDEEVKQGKWAWMRLSWAASRQHWESLIELAERLGGIIYDGSGYVTRDNLDSVLEEAAKFRELLGTPWPYKSKRDTSEIDVARLLKPFNDPDSVIHAFCENCDTYFELSAEELEVIKSEAFFKIVTDPEQSPHFLYCATCTECNDRIQAAQVRSVPSAK